MNDCAASTSNTAEKIIHHPLLAAVTELKGVGQQLAGKLSRLNIVSILDLLLHLPYKYQDRTRITPIAALIVNSHAVIEAQVVAVKPGFSKAKKRTLSLYVQDASGYLELKFFQYNNNQLEQFKRLPVIRCFGESKYGQKSLVMFHPEYQIIDETFINPVEDNLRPVYPSTEGISQKRWLQLTDSALAYMDSITTKTNNPRELDYLPESILSKNNLIDFVPAVNFIHRPSPEVSITLLDKRIHQAQQRLIFEELLAQYLAMRLAKDLHSQRKGKPLPNKSLSEELLDLLPFELTDAQCKVYLEISLDLAKAQPMTRLLQGDVGSGKTIIAALAALQAVSSGYQAAIMAPTEILATQHYNNLNKYFELLNIKAQLLISKQTAKYKREVKQQLKANEIKIIIGTHALIQGDVEFSNLALVVIDEQHRFGVEQRDLLWQKGTEDQLLAHQLTMTATPIPRTLAMTLYSDMDYSVIDKLPPGRKPINTVVMPDLKRADVITRIKSVCSTGRQVYWVCTLIVESEALTCQAAEDTYQHLAEELKPLKVGLVHGRLKQDEKTLIMQRFKDNELNILVATTVIEVGVDVPNASLMVIENPERLGLSQLHQLRGRVGRGSADSFCVLLYKSPLSETAQARLKAIRETQNGFKLAEYDLKLRGSGELLGKRQTGCWNLKIADIVRDKELIPDITKAANNILSKNRALVEPLVKLWLGDNYKFGQT